MNAHWTQRWIGQDAADCAALVAHVLAQEFGRAVILPAAPGGIRANDRAIRDALTGCLARPLGKSETPVDGDGVLMRARGRRSGVGHHIGLYAALPDPACLHWRAGLGTVLHPLRMLPPRGLEVVGLYRWKEEGDL
ncbi:hypothetical protein [Ruegeria atlantica]|uniref:hypothetical protein n=1 Tax=Ruegeria atlantica TaxID=81569 RepID=UPI00147E801C|nr:hypothetical protein [Ruegeria atlantica]